MSPFAILILAVATATVVGILIYLWWIKAYYWTKKQKKERREQGKREWLD